MMKYNMFLGAYFCKVEPEAEQWGYTKVWTEIFEKIGLVQMTLTTRTNMKTYI